MSRSTRKAADRYAARQERIARVNAKHALQVAVSAIEAGDDADDVGVFLIEAALHMGEARAWRNAAVDIVEGRL